MRGMWVEFRVCVCVCFNALLWDCVSLLLQFYVANKKEDNKRGGPRSTNIFDFFKALCKINLQQVVKPKEQVWTQSAVTWHPLFNTYGGLLTIIRNENMLVIKRKSLPIFIFLLSTNPIWVITNNKSSFSQSLIASINKLSKSTKFTEFKESMLYGLHDRLILAQWHISSPD